MPRLELSFAPQHPSTQGHFDNNPIIPGALLLAQVLCVIQEALPAVRQVMSLKAAKFTHPLRPGESFVLDYEFVAGEIKFKCATASHSIVSGSFKCLHLATPI